MGLGFHIPRHGQAELCQTQQCCCDLGIARTLRTFTDGKNTIEYRLGLLELALHAVQIGQGEKRHRRELMVLAERLLGLGDEPLRKRDAFGISTGS